MVTCLLDTVSPSSTQFTMFNRLKCEKELIVLPSHVHESLNVEINDNYY